MNHQQAKQAMDDFARSATYQDFESSKWVELVAAYNNSKPKIRRKDNKDTGGWIVFIIVMIIFFIYKVNTWNTVSALVAR